MKSFKIANLGCAHCAEKMEQKIGKIKGVEAAQVNFLTSKLFLECAAAEENRILSEAQGIISKIEPACRLEVK